MNCALWKYWVCSGCGLIRCDTNYKSCKKKCLQTVITDCHEILILIHYCLRIESDFAETVYADTIQEIDS